MGFLEDVELLYETRPYPPVSVLSPLFQKVDRDSLVLLNYSAGFSACYGTSGGQKKRPKILVAGCGTFEPVVVAMANPDSEIVAVDLSEASLKKLRWQLQARGLSQRVRLWKGDFQKLPEYDFDYILATGVLHHLEDPEQGLRALLERSSAKPVLRIMLYSRWGRSLLYGAKRLGEILGIKNPRDFRSMMSRLPPDHPYRIYFHLYSDAEADDGLADGYLHPCDRPFVAEEVQQMLSRNSLRVGKFLHKFEGQPDYADELLASSLGKPLDALRSMDPWKKLAALEALAQLDENFLFFAGKDGNWTHSPEAWMWNPSLSNYSKKGIAYSKIVGKSLAFDQRIDPAKHENFFDLCNGLFVLPKEVHEV